MEEQLLSALNDLVKVMSKPRPIIPIDNALWDADSCAEYLVVSKSHFISRIAAKPDFPKCINISTGIKNRDPRWRAVEVMKWVDSKQERRRA